MYLFRPSSYRFRVTCSMEERRRPPNPRPAVRAFPSDNFTAYCFAPAIQGAEKLPLIGAKPLVPGEGGGTGESCDALQRRRYWY